MKVEEVIQKKEIKVYCEGEKGNSKLSRHLGKKSQVGNQCLKGKNVPGQVDMP